MLISEVKEKYPLVYKRVLAQKLGSIDLAIPAMDLNRCLIWRNTKEGPEFWHHMEYQNIDMAKSICPHLFEEEEKDKSSYKVVANGLFRTVI